jgi:hypothetical protein
MTHLSFSDNTIFSTIYDSLGCLDSNPGCWCATNLATLSPRFYKFTFIIVEAYFYRFTYLRKYCTVIISVQLLKNLLICEMDKDPWTSSHINLIHHL